MQAFAMLGKNGVDSSLCMLYLRSKSGIPPCTLSSPPIFGAGGAEPVGLPRLSLARGSPKAPVCKAPFLNVLFDYQRS
jgi:hypothetical protein